MHRGGVPPPNLPALPALLTYAAPLRLFSRRAQLREKREELNKSIAADEEEKGACNFSHSHRRRFRSPRGMRLCLAAKIQNDLRILTERLARINDNLARKISSRTEYDKTITEVRAIARRPSARRLTRARPTHSSCVADGGGVFPYSKIMESSQTLLHVLKRESVNLTKKKQSSE